MQDLVYGLRRIPLLGYSVNRASKGTKYHRHLSAGYPLPKHSGLDARESVQQLPTPGSLYPLQAVRERLVRFLQRPDLAAFFCQSAIETPDLPFEPEELLLRELDALICVWPYELVTEVHDIFLEPFSYDHLGLGRIKRTVMPVGGAI
jgi:hypothetical protein